MSALTTTRLDKLGEPRRGKVRDTYDLGDCLLIVSTDRISAFDVVLPTGIPDKGRVLNQMSAAWFSRLGGVIPNHLISISDAQIAQRLGDEIPELVGRAALVRAAEPLPIEFVVRGYIAGSLYKEYKSQGPNVYGLALPEGLQMADRLPSPIFTPATKNQTGHDENISFDRACEIVDRKTMEALRDVSLELYARAYAHAERAGLILADTKFEFGRVGDDLIWIDEALTPDSSRFWEANSWRPGESPANFDKQYVRDWLETQDWDKTPPAPELPEQVVAETRSKYLEAFRRLVGRELD